MKGAAGSGVVAQDELVRLPDLDVKVFDTCDMLEAYLQTYSKTYISAPPARTRNERFGDNDTADSEKIPIEMKFYNVCTHFRFEQFERTPQFG
ncbi:hypothetical protein PR003_g27955 [Phytophthora rubi]|uniref:Uncharacterized protein n=1 Tax=Phytophthora rubi TaxID=129364 RepID=A0A6A4C2S3_9STRA|nr:hypothetical protein PR003_g27955 [Phytophthora rubi]